MSQRIISQISQLFAAGRFAEAEKLCLSAAQTSPGDGMIPAFRGAIKLELGDIKSAVVFLSKSISVDPGNATAHFNLGVLFMDFLPDKKKAREHFQVYRKVAPSADARQKEAESRLKELR